MGKTVRSDGARARGFGLAIGIAIAIAAASGCGFLGKKKNADAGAVASAEPAPSASTAPAAEPEAVNAKEIARFQDETLLARDAAKTAQPALAHKTPGGEKVAALPQGTDVTRIAQRKASFLVTFSDPSNKSQTLMGWINEVAFKPLPPLAKGQCRSDADCRKPSVCFKPPTSSPLFCAIPCDMTKAGSCPAGFDCAGTATLVSKKDDSAFCVDVDDDDDAPAADAGAKPIASGDAGSKPVATGGDAGSKPVATTGFKVGDKVQVEWHGSWYKATVIGVPGKDSWRIHYDGYGDSYDENVGPSRIKAR
jgi:hypothetical protein